MNKKVRLIFCTYSSIYSSIVLKQLIEADCIEVVAIVNSTRVLRPKFGQIRGAIEQIKLSGFRYSLYLFAITDFFAIRQYFGGHKVNALTTIHTLAAQNNIPILDSHDINQPNSLDFIEKNNPEYLLAAHFNQLVKQELLNSPKITCINIHPSFLPSYKGVDPVFFAQLDECEEFGVTLHKMEESFDTGEILSQNSLLINSKETTFSINKKLFFIGAHLAINWICESKYATLKPPINGNDRYDSWPNRQQLHQFKTLGKCLITIPEIWQ